MVPAPEKLSQVWIFLPPIPLFQQGSDSRRVRFDGLENGLKSPGCRWISVASSGMKKEENTDLSVPYGRYWIALEHKGRLLRHPNLRAGYGLAWRYVPRDDERNVSCACQGAPGASPSTRLRILPAKAVIGLSRIFRKVRS
jgi:hypothetical protein